MIEFELLPGDSLVQKFFEIWHYAIDNEEPVTFQHNDTRIIIIADKSHNFAMEHKSAKTLDPKGHRVVLIPPGYKIKLTKERKKKSPVVEEVVKKQ